MNELTVLLLGIGLGLRHATDADHVVVVSTLLQREPGTRQAARVAALWGLGHTLSFFSVGLLIVALGVQIPESFETFAEILVALMLMSFGVWHALRQPEPRREEAPVGPARASQRLQLTRPVLVGLVHGLAGSAGVALLVSATIASRALATFYLALFGLGTVLGMVLLTLLLARPLAWMVHHEQDKVRRGVTLLAAALSFLLGLWILVEAVWS